MAHDSSSDELSDRGVTRRESRHTTRRSSHSKTEKPKKKKKKPALGGININMSNSNNIGVAPKSPGFKPGFESSGPIVEEVEDDFEEERVRMERLTIEKEEKKKEKRRALEAKKEESEPESESEPEVKAEESSSEEEETTTITKRKKPKPKPKANSSETTTITTTLKTSERSDEDEEFARRCPHVSWFTQDNVFVHTPGFKRQIIEFLDGMGADSCAEWDENHRQEHEALAAAGGWTLEQYRVLKGRQWTPDGHAYTRANTVLGSAWFPTVAGWRAPVVGRLPVLRGFEVEYGVGFPGYVEEVEYPGGLGGGFGGGYSMGFAGGMSSSTRMQQSVQRETTTTTTSRSRMVVEESEDEEEEVTTKVVKKTKKTKK